MTDRSEPMMQGLPGGGAELSVVLSLGWDDVAALGREASRLAEQRGGPVTLDEAASHRLRTWSSVANGPDERHRTVPAPPATPAPAAETAALTPPPGADRTGPQVTRLSDTSPVATLPSTAAQHAQVRRTG
ncbi:MULTISPECIES: hypothetical protein [unclassified Streptomyces]|uniref:hypothetical protein n=1 Tax=unclassified Streptomyces TaxID=2593676 RepID=UPI0007C814BD|nr:hypothetical protein [Streptomyces sp. NRRL S-118]